MITDGPTNAAIFEKFVDWLLAPALPEGDLVVMDNLPSHNSPRPSSESKRQEPSSFTCRRTALTSTRSRRSYGRSRSDAQQAGGVERRIGVVVRRVPWLMNPCEAGICLNPGVSLVSAN